MASGSKLQGGSVCKHCSVFDLRGGGDCRCPNPAQAADPVAVLNPGVHRLAEAFQGGGYVSLLVALPISQTHDTPEFQNLQFGMPEGRVVGSASRQIVQGANIGLLLNPVQGAIAGHPLSPVQGAVAGHQMSPVQGAIAHKLNNTFLGISYGYVLCAAYCTGKMDEDLVAVLLPALVTPRFLKLLKWLPDESYNLSLAVSVAGFVICAAAIIGAATAYS